MDNLKQAAAPEALEALPEDDFDIGSIDLVKNANEGAGVRLSHPISGRELKIVVYVIGRDSDKFKELQAEKERNRMARAARGHAAAIMDPRAQEQEGIELLAACTLGWDKMKLNGRDVPFSVANAEIIYTSHPWIKEQIDRAIADRAVFTKA